MMVVDFVKDELDQIYMVDVNGFRVSEFEKVARFTMMSEDERLMKEKESLDIQNKANNTVLC